MAADDDDLEKAEPSRWDTSAGGRVPTYSGHKLRRRAASGLGEMNAMVAQVNRMMRTQPEDRSSRTPPHVVTAIDVTRGLGFDQADEQRLQRLLQDTPASFTQKTQTQRRMQARQRLQSVLRQSMRHVDSDARMEVVRRADAYWRRNAQTDYGKDPTVRFRDPVTKAFVIGFETLLKGRARGGAYYKREPTGNPKNPWRYYYTKEQWERAQRKKKQKAAQKQQLSLFDRTAPKEPAKPKLVIPKAKLDEKPSTPIKSPDSLQGMEKPDTRRRGRDERKAAKKPSLQEMEDGLLDYLRQSGDTVTVASLVASFDVSPAKTRSVLEALVREGKLEVAGKARSGNEYRLKQQDAALTGADVAPEAAVKVTPSRPAVGDDGLTDHQRERKERAEAKARRLKAKAAAEWERSREPTRGIPMGQPILGGHHSERKHRRAIETSDKRARAAIATAKEAERASYATSRAGTAISSDDPDAVPALEQKLAALEAQIKRKKEMRAAYRKNGVAGLVAIGIPQKAAEAMEARKPHYQDNVVPAYELKNANANKNRIKKRIEELKRRAGEEERPPIHGKGFSIVESKEDNRIRFAFDSKPSRDVIEKVKRAGFRWSRTEGAWQRQLNNAGRYAARALAKDVFDHDFDKPAQDPAPTPADPTPAPVGPALVIPKATLAKPPKTQTTGFSTEGGTWERAMEHAEKLAELIRERGVRTAKAWGQTKDGSRKDVRVYLPGGQYLSIGQDGTVKETSRGREVFDSAALYPNHAKAVAEARASHRDWHEAILSGENAALEEQSQIEKPLKTTKTPDSLQGMETEDTPLGIATRKATEMDAWLKRQKVLREAAHKGVEGLVGAGMPREEAEVLVETAGIGDAVSAQLSRRVRLKKKALERRIKNGTHTAEDAALPPPGRAPGSQSPTGAGEAPTEKQIAYARDLLRKLSPWDWDEMTWTGAVGRLVEMPTLTDLSSWSRKDIATLIRNIRALW